MLDILDIDKLKSSGYQVDIVDKNIYIIKDFIQSSDIDYVYDFAESLSEEQWRTAYMDNLRRTCLQSFGTDDLEELVKSKKIIINEKLADKSITTAENTMDPSIPRDVQVKLWAISCGISNDLSKFITGYDIRPFGVIQRHYPGVGLDEHVDQHNDPSLKYACVAYLNDNYEGGELYFPDRGITVKPDAGSIAVFDASSDYLHGVHPVTGNNTRYAMTSFIWDKSH